MTKAQILATKAAMKAKHLANKLAKAKAAKLAATPAEATSTPMAEHGPIGGVPAATEVPVAEPRKRNAMGFYVVHNPATTGIGFTQ